MLKPSTATANAALDGTGLKEQFDGGFLYIFAGPVPPTADTTLDMVAAHTELVKISLNAGATGLTFAAPAGGVLGKTPAETWSGAASFDGYEDTETSLAPTFYRFCTGGDNGQGVADPSTGFRMQGTCGGPNSGADLQVGTAMLTDGNTQPIGAFSWELMR